MKALAYDRFGGAEVLHFAELPDPVAKDGEVVIAITARSVNLIDLKVRSGAMGPLVNKRFPKVPGADFAGTVAAVGAGVNDLAPGDLVFGAADPFRGGAFAERIAVPRKQVAGIPGGMTPEAAAMLPVAGLAALQALRDLGGLLSGQSVLVHGATGPVGLYAVQIGRWLGAEVTAVAGAGLDTAARLGAQRLVDYRNSGRPRLPENLDVILNASGHLPWAVGKVLLGPRGKLVEPSPTIPVFIGSKLGNLFRRRKHQVLATSVNSADLNLLAELVTTGKLEPVIAATYPFAQAAAALSQVERGGVIGKVVITG